MRKHLFAAAVVSVCAGSALAGNYDLKTDWSDLANPNGVWSYREAGNALPHVANWQSVQGGWATPQPGWARSESGTDRLPFFFKSNGSETFTRDFVAGDIIVHTTDGTNGVGQGAANYLWTSPDAGTVNITGGVWMGRDIQRSNHWALAKNGNILTEGDISSGDVYSRATPFNFNAGTGGASAVTNLPIAIGDLITLTFTNTSGSGDFVGTNLTLVTTVPEPTILSMLALGGGMMLRRRRAK